MNSFTGRIGRMLEAEFRKETHINRAIRAVKAHTYLEIGVAAGDCFHHVKAPRKIAVDPAPRDFNHELAPGEFLFEMTSDAFFSEKARDILAAEKIDVALVDGLHEFGQVLRDVVNLEKFMSPQGVIFIHDCNPPTRKHAEVRDGGVWNGDVWKCAYYLTAYRPDLHFFTLDCDWGLGVLTGFRSFPGTQAPSSDITNTCKLLDYSVLERQRKRILRLHSVWYSSLFFGFIHARRVKQGRDG